MEGYSYFCIFGMLFMIVNGDRKVIDMSYLYNTNNTLTFPGFSPMDLQIIFRGWTEIHNRQIWLEYNKFEMPEHVGTHMDAPSHFGIKEPGAWRVNEIPVERLLGHAVVIDISYKADPYTNPDAALEVSDIMRWEGQYGMIREGDIILVHSGWQKYWGNAKLYLGNDQDDANNLHFPGISKEAAQWLVDNRPYIYGVGVDTMTLDPGKETGFPAHLTILPNQIYGLENVKNMDKLPPYGARLYVGPMKIYMGSGGPTRIIAEFDDTSPVRSEASKTFPTLLVVFAVICFYAIHQM